MTERVKAWTGRLAGEGGGGGRTRVLKEGDRTPGVRRVCMRSEGRPGRSDRGGASDVMRHPCCCTTSTTASWQPDLPYQAACAAAHAAWPHTCRLVQLARQRGCVLGGAGGSAPNRPPLQPACPAPHTFSPPLRPFPGRPVMAWVGYYVIRIYHACIGHLSSCLTPATLPCRRGPAPCWLPPACACRPPSCGPRGWSSRWPCCRWGRGAGAP